MRLVDAEELLFELANESFPQSVQYGQGRNSIIESIKNAPTIDAVPVVRCINCKYNDSDEGIRYRFCPDPTGRFFLLNGFCSCGERKGNEG